MGDKDIISKHLIKRIVKDIARYLFNLELSEIEVLETQYQRVEERRADIVARATRKDKPVLLHIEVQNDNDKIMPLRMLRYYTDIALHWPNEPIEQYLIYIGKERLTMPAGIDQLNLQYHYHLIDMHDIDCHTFLQQDNPDALILAILCDFKGRDEKDVISHIIKRLQALTKDNEKAFREFISMRGILSTNQGACPRMENYVRARQKFVKKRSLHVVNEHFECIFNAAMAERSVFGQVPSAFCYH